MFSLTAIKAVIGAAVFAVVFGAGWMVNQWRWDAKYEARENQLLKEVQDAQAAAQKIYDLRKADADAAQQKYSTDTAALNARINALKEKLKNAQLTVPQCEHPFTTELPSELNRLSDAADGVSAPAAGAPDSTGAAPAAPPTSEVTGNDLVEWYAEVARLYGQCKAQLDAIRDWDSHTTH